MKIAARYLVPVLLVLGWQGQALAQQVRPPVRAGAASVSAQQTGYVDFMAGLGYTDNALLARGPRKSDGIGTAGLDVDYRHLGELSLNLLGNLDRVEYISHSFGGSFYGHFFGMGVLGKPTSVLQWRLSDSFGEQMTNPLTSPTPRNLQTLNDVQTGPMVNLHFGLTNRLTLFGLYSRTTYQRSPFDSQTYEGGAQFRHALSGASFLSLQASTAHTKYIDRTAVQSLFNGAPDYDIRRASISYSAKYVRTDVVLRAGYNTITHGGAPTHGAPLYAVRISRRISPFSTVFVSGRQIYTTNGASLASAGAQIGLQAGASLNPGHAVPQPFNVRSVDAGWLFSRARTSLSIMVNYRQDIFDQTSVTNRNNHKDEGVVLTLGRRLRPTVEVQLRAQGYENRYSRLDARTRRLSIRLTVSKHFARSAIWVYVERRHQSGSPGISTFQAASYNDDQVGVYVTYDLFGARPAQRSLQGLPGMAGSIGRY